MKKLLVIYASYGTGHKAVAVYIKKYFEEHGYEVKAVDLLNYSMPLIGSISKQASEFLMTKLPGLWSALFFGFDNRFGASVSQEFLVKIFKNKTLKNDICSFKPDIVIATHYFGSTLIAKYQKWGFLKTKLITVVTDYKAHDVWLKEVKSNDAIVVGGQDEKKRLLKYGYAARQIYTTGIPITPLYNDKFNKEAFLRKYKLSNKKTVLFFLGGGKGTVNNLKYLKEILKISQKMNLLVIAGKNKKVLKKTESYVNKYKAKNVKAFGFVTNIADFYMASDFVVTKPGGAQVTECLYFRKPMILIKSNGGQEIGNRQFLIKKGYALASLSKRGFKKNFKKLVEDDKTLLKMVSNIDKIKQEKSMENLFKLSEKLLK